MKITEIYKKYKIPPNLELHQLRVAAVAKIICDNFEKKLDKNSIITACLLHDMGNILKFNFDIFDDDFYAPKGRNYWKRVQQEFRKKYGDDEYGAAEEILSELGIKESICKLNAHIQFSQAGTLIESSNFGKKIRFYSDCRVSPFSVVSLEERMEEGSKRYALQKGKYNEDEFNLLANHAKTLENQIFKRSKIKPSDITDENVNPLVEELKDFEIKTR